MRKFEDGTSVLYEGLACRVDRWVGGGDYIVVRPDGEKRAANERQLTALAIAPPQGEFAATDLRTASADAPAPAPATPTPESIDQALAEPAASVTDAPSGVPSP